MNIDIVRLRPSDMALLDRIAPDVFDEPVRQDRLAACLAEPGHHLWVAVAGGEVVAQAAAIVHRHPDKATEFYIDEVGVTPALQRHGIATRRLDELFAFASSIGCEEAWVGTEPDNVAARSLYERFGGKAGTFVMYEYEL